MVLIGSVLLQIDAVEFDSIIAYLRKQLLNGVPKQQYIKLQQVNSGVL